MYPSTPPETGRDSWPENRPGPAGPHRAPDPRGRPAGPDARSPFDGPRPADGPRLPDGSRHGDGARPGDGPRNPDGPRPGDGPRGTDGPRPDGGVDPAELDGEEELPPVPVRRLLSVAIAGFAGLLGVGLIFGAQTAGPGARLPFAVVVLGVQLLFVLAWTMAMRPPALPLVGGVAVAVALAADAAAVLPQIAVLAPLGYVAAGGFLVGVLGQLVRRADRARVTESLGATLFIVVGVVAFGTLIVLSRIPKGTQAIFVCLTAAAVALTVARVTDAVLPWPRLAPQVPRGAAGVVIGAMLGTLAAGILGSYLVAFTPTSAAVVGLVTAAAAALADLGVGYAEAGRQMAGEPPTMWVARHMQGPLGGFALAAPAAYAMSVFFL
ncbi:hypothetical protein GCM10022225_21440 [Plantactinospora mayteni]|uniref:CDP-diglyceride synthetase n=1 Tax=Plantactinospora mayteni TaxID=566021 RepID=A0ABQ4ENU9_9ACTN|nr:hypothetical protein [Plantactinospora mayteni]GIG96325.1 hypothetical protein Pma05_28980 [Plantactinospora mayteni]